MKKFLSEYFYYTPKEQRQSLWVIFFCYLYCSTK